MRVSSVKDSTHTLSKQPICSLQCGDAYLGASAVQSKVGQRNISLCNASDVELHVYKPVPAGVLYS